jgi:hypothetical protein
MTTNNNSNICITLLSFNKIVSIDKAGLIYNEIYNPQFTGYDAEVTTNIDLLTFKKMFCFQSDYIDVNNANELDVKYYVLKNRIVSFIPDFQDATITLNPIVQVTPNGTILTPGDQNIGKDFIRFLAYLLFNTPYGSDLFVNEDELVESVIQALTQAWMSCATDLQNISNESTANILPMTGNSPAKYLTNSTMSILNICRELFLQLISKSPTRFTNMPNLEDTGSDIQDIREGKLKYYNLPFLHGDCVKIQVKLNPAVNQDTFGLTPLNSDKFDTVNNISQLKGRTYLINMVLTESQMLQTLTPIPVSYDSSRIGTRSTLNTLVTQPFVSQLSAEMASNPYCSFKVIGKNNSLLNGKLEYLPVLLDASKLKIEATTTVVDSNTLIIKMYYDIISSPNGAGIGFSKEAIDYYNDNIETIEFLTFGGFPLFDGGFQFMSLNSQLLFSADLSDIPTLQTPTSLCGAFSNMAVFNTNINFLYNWDLSKITDFSFMFCNSPLFNNGTVGNTGSSSNSIYFPPTSSLIYLNNMFAGATSFNQSINFYDISNVIDMSSMFDGATSFNQELNFDTSQVTDMSSMFAGATSFNKNIFFNTAEVTDMSSMLAGATSFNSYVPLYTINVTNMSNMFAGASSFNQSVYFYTGQVTNMSSMFAGASSYNELLSLTNTSQVTNMSSMFAGATSFNQELNFDTSQVTNMSSMFSGATSFNQAVKLNFNTSQVTNMNRMFECATSFNQELNLNTSQVTDMSYMFAGATSFNTEIMFDTSQVTNMSSMFALASSFNREPLLNTSQVTNMSSMFAGATLFNQVVDFNTAEVTDMNSMFDGATSFNQLLDFNTIQVTNMSSMFAGATSFNQYVVLDTGKVTNMSSMFAGATSFNQYVSFNTSQLTNISYMFAGATSFNNGGFMLFMDFHPLMLLSLNYLMYDHLCPSWLPENKPPQLNGL